MLSGVNGITPIIKIRRNAEYKAKGVSRERGIAALDQLPKTAQGVIQIAVVAATAVVETAMMMTMTMRTKGSQARTVTPARTRSP